MFGDALITVTKDIGREVIAPVHNSLGRYVIWPAISGTAEAAVGTIGLGAVDVARNILEYGVVRPFVAYPIKLAARGFIETYNKLNNTTVQYDGPHGLPRLARRVGPRLPDIPDGRFFPRVGFENIWRYGHGANAVAGGWAGGGLPARRGWARQFSLFWDSNNASPRAWHWLRHGEGPGKYIRPSTIPKWYVHDWQRPDVFDRTKISEPRAHSPQWYQDYLNCLTEETVRTWNEQIQYHLTPRTDADPANGIPAANYVDHNDVAGIAIGAGAGPGGIPGPGDANAKDYYPNPDLWELLTSNDPNKQLVGYGYIFKKIKTIVATEHLQIHEQRKWAIMEKKLAPKIERARTYEHYYEAFIRGLEKIGKGSYGIDDFFLGEFFALVMKGLD